MNPVKKMLKDIKRTSYFWVANYFAFWAYLFLKRWKPMVITVTGSSGKTTLLHLFEAQLQDKAIYSHKANSAFGIPFHILGLERKSFKIYEWFLFFILAPIKVFRKVPKQRIYVTEADAERPSEAGFIAALIKPHVVVWLSLEEAHGINYDKLFIYSENNLEKIKQAIAQEFSAFIKSDEIGWAVLNKDNTYIVEASRGGRAEKKFISEKEVYSFIVHKDSVDINTSKGSFSVPALIPESAALSVLAVITVLDIFAFPKDPKFSHFTLPPGRSSVFAGIKNTVLIDSTYNATFDGMRSMLDLMRQYPATGEKWLVLGDMIEQGKSETEEHTQLAEMIEKVNPARVILVGPRLEQHTYPVLESIYKEKVVAYRMPGEALEYLQKELKGGETILFKGARFLEGIVEKLLENPKDAEKLCRREEIWVKKRQEWGI